MNSSQTNTKPFADVPHIPSADHKWVVGQGIHNGAPLLVRCNISAKDWIGDPRLSTKLCFAIPLRKASPHGLPDPNENSELARIEDLIVGEIGKCCLGIFAMVLTTGMMREFVFYINECDDIAAIQKSIQQQVSSHIVQYIMVKEADWKSYCDFNPMK